MNKTVHILGIPMDLGAGRRGVDMGPSAIRLAKLHEEVESLGYELLDHGNVEVPIPQSVRAQHFAKYEQVSASGATSPVKNAHYADSIITICQQAYSKLKDLPEDAFPVILGGDHAISIGSVAGVAHNPHHQARGEGRTGVLWVDAHSDLNTPAISPSGNVHGMPLATLLDLEKTALSNVWGGGAILRPEDIVYIGLRSVDAEEKRLIREHNIKAYDTNAIDFKGLNKVIDESLEYLAHVDNLHVSFDADVLDPSIAPGVGTPVNGGLTFREAHYLMERLAASGRVTSVDLVEVNPILDNTNSTGKIMVDLLLSLLGRTVL